MAELASFDEGDRIRLIGKNIANPAAALKAVGVHLSSQYQRAFDRQGLKRRDEWKPRGVPNKAGIISDLNKGGKTVKQRRLEPRKALIDTNRLRGSISWRQISDTSIEVGSNVPYASVHNFGGESEVPVTAQAQTTLRDALKKKKPPKLIQVLGRAFARRMLKVDSFKVRVPERKFVGITPSLRVDVTQIVARFVAKGG